MKHRDALSSAILFGNSLIKDFGGTLSTAFKGVAQGGDHIEGKLTTPSLGIVGAGLTTLGVMSFNPLAFALGTYLLGDAGGRYLEAGRAVTGPSAPSV